MTSAIFEELRAAVVSGDSERAKAAATKAIEAKIPPLDAITNGLAKGVREVGDKFGEGEVFLVELIASGKAMKAGVSTLLPMIKASKSKVKTLGKVLLGTVEGDIHSIGKDIVATMLEANGFEVINLGEDIPARVFVEKARELDVDVIGLSALLTSSMLKQKETVEAAKAGGLRAKVMIGGAPTTKDWANKIGADGWAGDATTAAALAKTLVGAKEFAP
jgi:corrinoid protein of di/trimethylamine methyltransferase